MPVPVIVPVVEEVTVSVYCVVFLGLKVAVTVFAASTVISHSVWPEQSPPHPVKDEVADGSAVNITVDLLSTEAVHPEAQLVPAGSSTTVPLPEPDILTVRSYFVTVMGSDCKIVLPSPVAIKVPPP